MLINSVEEMINYGENISTKYHKIALYGDLGVGKTHFTKGFAKGLNIDTLQIQSPTYTIMNTYDYKLLHIDMYRLENPNELIEKGVFDYINEFEFIVIEWPKFENMYLDESWLKIKINKINENSREIEIL